MFIVIIILANKLERTSNTNTNQQTAKQSTKCTPEYPYYDIYTMSCTKDCGHTTGTIKIDTNNNCITECPKATYKFSRIEICIMCDGKTPYFSDNLMQCTSDCTAPTNNIIINKDNICLDECAGAYTQQAGYKLCSQCKESSTDNKYFHYDPDNILNSKCVSKCQNNYYDRNNKCLDKCVGTLTGNLCTKCPGTTPFFDTSSKKCVKQCNEIHIVDNDGACIAQCPITSYQVSLSTFYNYQYIQCTTCSVNQYYNKSTHECVSACASLVYDKNKICLDQCNGELDTHVCSKCPDKKPFYDKLTKLCTSSCPSKIANLQNDDLVCQSICYGKKQISSIYNISYYQCTKCPINTPFFGKSDCVEKCETLHGEKMDKIVTTKDFVCETTAPAFYLRQIIQLQKNQTVYYVSLDDCSNSLKDESGDPICPACQKQKPFYDLKQNLCTDSCQYKINYDNQQYDLLDENLNCQQQACQYYLDIKYNLQLGQNYFVCTQYCASGIYEKDIYGYLTCRQCPDYINSNQCVEKCEKQIDGVNVVDENMNCLQECEGTDDNADFNLNGFFKICVKKCEFYSGDGLRCLQTCPENNVVYNSKGMRICSVNEITDENQMKELQEGDGFPSFDTIPKQDVTLNNKYMIINGLAVKIDNCMDYAEKRYNSYFFTDSNLTQCLLKCNENQVFIDKDKICLDECPPTESKGKFFIDIDICVESCWDSKNNQRLIDKLQAKCVAQCAQLEILDTTIIAKESVCTDCKENYFQQDTKCVETCDSTHIFRNFSIKPNECLVKCPSIQNIVNEEMECVEKCEKFYIRVKQGEIDYIQCVPSCTGKFVKSEDELECIEKCVTASTIIDGENYCTIGCTVGQKIYKNTCVDNCTGYAQYKNECFDSCDDVKNPNITHLYLSENECVEECPNFIDSTEKFCIEKCEKYVLKDKYCTDSCNITETNFFVDISNNCLLIEKCPSKKFIQDKKIQCLDSCLKLNMKMLQNEFQCVQQCNPEQGAVEMGSEEVCVICRDLIIPMYFVKSNEKCAFNCEKAGFDYKCFENCSEAGMGLYLQNGTTTCVSECAFETHIFEGKCVNCSSLNIFINEKECVSTCSPKKIDLSNQCILECQKGEFELIDGSETRCVECLAEYYLDEGICVEKCSQKRPFTEKGSKICSETCQSGVVMVNQENVCILETECEQYLTNESFGEIKYWKCTDSCKLLNMVVQDKYCVNECTDKHGAIHDSNLNEDVCKLCSEEKKMYYKGECVDSCSLTEIGKFEFSGVCYESCIAAGTENGIELYIQGNKCVATCDSGLLLNKKSFECIDKCPDAMKFIENNTCLENCPGNEDDIIFINLTYHCQKACSSFKTQVVANDIELVYCTTNCSIPGFELQKSQNEKICVDKCDEGLNSLTINGLTTCTVCKELKPPMYIDQGKCILSCQNVSHNMACYSSCQEIEEGLYTEEKNCVKQCQFFYNSNMQCISKCPSDQKYYSGKQCFSKCEKFITHQNECVDECPNSVYQKLCVERCNSSQIQSGKECTDCPTVIHENVCYQSCAVVDKNYYQQENNCVQQCDSTYKYVTGQKLCLLHCKDSNMYYNVSNNQCQQQCGGNFSYQDQYADTVCLTDGLQTDDPSKPNIGLIVGLVIFALLVVGAVIFTTLYCLHVKQKANIKGMDKVVDSFKKCGQKMKVQPKRKNLDGKNYKDVDYYGKKMDKQYKQSKTKPTATTKPEII